MYELYELSENIQAIREQWEEGELDEQTAKDTLESLMMEQEDGYENAVKWLRNLLQEEAAYTQEARYFFDKAAARAAQAERIKDFMQDCMERCGQKKVKAGLFTLTIQRNGGKQSLKIGCKPEDLPKEFQKNKILADTEKIRNFLENGGENELFCLEPRGESLRIR